jgi:hypothetical protein
MEQSIEWLPILLAALLAISEVLGMFPAVKANGVFQLVYSMIKKAKEVLLPKK